MVLTCVQKIDVQIYVEFFSAFLKWSLFGKV